MIGVLSAQIMQACINIQNNFPELRGPTRRLISAGHELRMVVDGFKQRHLEDVSNIKNPVSAFAETAFAVWTDVRERGHQITCAIAANAAIFWNKIKIADIFHDARVGLLLSGYEQRPILWVGDIVE